MKIYEIPGALRELLDRLDADPDTGEVDGEALAAYAEYTTAAAEKLEGTACYCRELKAEAEAIKAEEERLAKRRKALENKSERLKAYMMPALEAMGGKVKGVMVSLRIGTTQAVKVLDLEVLPATGRTVDFHHTITRALPGAQNGKGRNVLKRPDPYQVVERRRIELPTSALRTQRSPS